MAEAQTSSKKRADARQGDPDRGPGGRAGRGPVRPVRLVGREAELASRRHIDRRGRRGSAAGERGGEPVKLAAATTPTNAGRQGNESPRRRSSTKRAGNRPSWTTVIAYDPFALPPRFRSRRRWQLAAKRRSRRTHRGGRGR